MKYAFVIFAMLALAGCNDYKSERKAGYSTTSYNLTCIDGVTYIKAGYGDKGFLTAKFDKHSKVVPCN